MAWLTTWTPRSRDWELGFHSILKRTWLHRCYLSTPRGSLAITIMRSNCHCPQSDSHWVGEWCPGWISFSPTGNVLLRSSDVFECLGPGGQHLILHGQKSITKPISLHSHWAQWGRVDFPLIVFPWLQRLLGCDEWSCCPLQLWLESRPDTPSFVHYYGVAVSLLHLLSFHFGLCMPDSCVRCWKVNAYGWSPPNSTNTLNFMCYSH